MAAVLFHVFLVASRGNFLAAHGHSGGRRCYSAKLRQSRVQSPKLRGGTPHNTYLPPPPLPFPSKTQLPSIDQKMEPFFKTQAGLASMSHDPLRGLLMYLRFTLPPLYTSTCYNHSNDTNAWIYRHLSTSTKLLGPACKMWELRMYVTGT